MRRLLLPTALALSLPLLAAPALGAAPTAGQWAGKLNEDADSQITFKVAKSKRKLTKFVIPKVYVVCGTQIEELVFTVPKAKVSKSGKFKGKFTVSEGNTFRLSGKFKAARKAAGTIHVDTKRCDQKLKFRAKRK